MQIKLIHKKDCTLRLVLKVTGFGTRKWPINLSVRKILSHQITNCPEDTNISESPLWLGDQVIFKHLIQKEDKGIFLTLVTKTLF